jgi:hypothetical protein
MEAALPGEETAAASALVSMNTSPAAAPRPAAPVSEAEVSVLAQVPVSCKQAACVTLAMCPLLNSSVWSPHTVSCDILDITSSIAQADFLAFQT